MSDEVSYTRRLEFALNNPHWVYLCEHNGYAILHRLDCGRSLGIYKYPLERWHNEPICDMEGAMLVYRED